MSKGAVLIANNTDRFDYIKLAAINAEKIKRNLKIPVALITESQVSNSIFDEVIIIKNTSSNQRIFSKTNEKLEWKNLNRTQVYDLTPWDRTLLLDADYLIQTNALANHLSSDFEFAIAKECYNPMTGSSYTMKMGKSNIDQLWATVMIFNKTDYVRKIFELAEYALLNYSYYHKLYGFAYFPYRNDYAFTIACHILGGYGATDFSLKGYQLVNCDFSTSIDKLNDSNILASYPNQDARYIQRIYSDVHIQDKLSLFKII
jgi:hypothetical protein